MDTEDISQSNSGFSGKILQIRDITDPKRHVIVNLDLNGRLMCIKLGTEFIDKELKILERSFNGKIYVYYGNCKNLVPENKEVYFYYDYYNRDINNDLMIANILVDAFTSFLQSNSVGKYVSDKKNIYVNNKIINNKILAGKRLSKLPLNLVNILENARLKYNWPALLNEQIIFQKIYSTPISVLPPEVRPDQNPIFVVIQMTHGCWLRSSRGPCKFCSSFLDVLYREKSLSELQKHFAQVKKYTGKGWTNVRKIFLSDADPLKTKTSSKIYLHLLAKMAPEIAWFESFVSTPTILSKSVGEWKNLMKLGLKKLYWGIESADDKTLKILGKAHNNKSLRMAAERLDEVGLNYVAIVMSGISFLNCNGKSQGDISLRPHIKKTTNFINKYHCPTVYISRFNPHPKSEIFALVKDKITKISPEERENEHRMIVKLISYDKYNHIVPKREVRGTYGVQFI